jgi:HSP20 family protein
MPTGAATSSFVVCFDLPGMDPGAIDLTVEQNVLTIKAERRLERREAMR